MNKDDSLDGLLRRTSRARGNARTETCLDAEMIAAWSEGGLTTHEREAAEAHAADCDRCLATLAALDRATPAVPARPSFRWLPVRWLVPIASATVAVIAWVLVQAPPPSAPPIPSSPQSSSAGDVAPPSAAPVAPGPSARADANRGSASDSERRRESGKRVAISPPVAAPRDEAARIGAPEKPLAAPAPPPAALPERLDAPPVSGPVRSVATPPPPPPAAAEPRAQTQIRAAAPAEPQVRGGMTQADKISEPIARQAASMPFDVSSPDRAVTWRVSGTVVYRSTDGGRTWQTQSTGTTGTLLAGSAPAPAVCWLVGRRGLVLVSTDGQTWRRTAFPDSSVDLVRVTAVDATTATVVTGDGRTYRTGDGGGTWMAQQNPAR